MTKSDITNELNQLKKIGWKIYNANSHKALPTGLRDFTDYLLAHHKNGLVFLECKIGDDELKPGQIETGAILTSLMNKCDKVKYWIITDKNYTEIINKILEVSL